MEICGRAIGIFDSGIGGLTVYKEMRTLLPHENLLYFGDTARVPYGTKSKETVIAFSRQNADFLMTHRVKMIVVACNTSSSVALPVLKRRYDVPVVGVVEPGAKAAAAATRNGKVGVIGTRATISSGVYERAIKKVNPRIEVMSLSCPLFVPLVEEGWLKEKATYVVASRYLRPLKNGCVDTLVLGCTHYPLLKGVIRDVLGYDIRLIDSATETAKTVRDVVNRGNIYSRRKQRGKDIFYVSDEPELFGRIGSAFLGKQIRGVKKVRME